MNNFEPQCGDREGDGGGKTMESEGGRHLNLSRLNSQSA